MLAREDAEVHLHALQAMTKQFQLCEWGHFLLGKLHCCSRITSGSCDAPNYPKNLPLISLLEVGLPDCRFPRVFSKRKLFLIDVGNSVMEDSSDHITRAFPVVWCSGFIVVTLSFTHLSITFSSQRFSSCNLNVGYYICESHVLQFFWKQSLQNEYSVLISPGLQYCNF
jgi:hypothetical protein